jgi:hypothetical protein
MKRSELHEQAAGLSFSVNDIITGETGFAHYSPYDEIEDLHSEAVRLARNSQADFNALIDWCQQAHDCLAANAERPGVVATWQARLLPFFLRSRFLQRCRAKPRGYAGDYLTIQMMYEAAASTSDDVFGRAADAWAMAQPCPRAVRNRRALVGDLIRLLRAQFDGEKLSVVSLGCGPAAEVFDSLPVGNACFRLVDIDSEAVAFVQQKARHLRAAGAVTPMLGNIIKMAVRKDDAIPRGQHAFYSLGVIDYFADQLVLRLLDYIHDRLAPGGVVMLGNFRPGHANAAFFEHALEWPLRLRSREQLASLVARSRFARCPTFIGSEAEGVQLFIRCVKA